MGYYFRRTSGPLKMGVARAGRRAKHAAHVYTRRKKTQGPPNDLLSRPSPSAGNCARAESEVELPGRGLGESLQARGVARGVHVCRARARPGKGTGGV